MLELNDYAWSIEIKWVLAQIIVLIAPKGMLSFLLNLRWRLRSKTVFDLCDRLPIDHLPQPVLEACELLHINLPIMCQFYPSDVAILSDIIRN